MDGKSLRVLLRIIQIELKKRDKKEVSITSARARRLERQDIRTQLKGNSLKFTLTPSAGRVPSRRKDFNDLGAYRLLTVCKYLVHTACGSLTVTDADLQEPCMHDLITGDLPRGGVVGILNPPDSKSPLPVGRELLITQGGAIVRTDGWEKQVKSWHRA